jgi:hypothetical protein
VAGADRHAAGDFARGSLDVDRLADPRPSGGGKRFRTQLRAPIETHGDAAAQARLNGRLRPFRLRRTKDEVAADVPAGTGVLERVGLLKPRQALHDPVPRHGRPHARRARRAGADDPRNDGTPLRDARRLRLTPVARSAGHGFPGRIAAHASVASAGQDALSPYNVAAPTRFCVSHYGGRLLRTAMEGEPLERDRRDAETLDHRRDLGAPLGTPSGAANALHGAHGLLFVHVEWEHRQDRAQRAGRVGGDT